MEKSRKFEILLNELLLQTSGMGIENTVNFYVKYLKLGGLVRELDKKTLYNHFEKLTKYRLAEAIKSGRDISKNLFFEKSIDYIFILFIEGPLEIYKENNYDEYDFEVYRVEYDLALFIIAALLLESEQYRKAFLTYTKSMSDNELTMIYKICKEEIPGQVFSSIESFKKIAGLTINEILKAHGMCY